MFPPAPYKTEFGKRLEYFEFNTLWTVISKIYLKNKLMAEFYRAFLRKKWKHIRKKKYYDNSTFLGAKRN